MCCLFVDCVLSVLCYCSLVVRLFAACVVFVRSSFLLICWLLVVLSLIVCCLVVGCVLLPCYLFVVCWLFAGALSVFVFVRVLCS